MGLGTDMLMEQMCEEAGLYHAAVDKSERIIRNYSLHKCIWRTKDGSTLDVRDMSNEHILNVKSYLITKTSMSEAQEVIVDAWIEVFDAELRRRNI